MSANTSVSSYSKEQRSRSEYSRGPPPPPLNPANHSEMDLDHHRATPGISNHSQFQRPAPRRPPSHAYSGEKGRIINNDDDNSRRSDMLDVSSFVVSLGHHPHTSTNGRNSVDPMFPHRGDTSYSFHRPAHDQHQRPIRSERSQDEIPRMNALPIPDRSLIPDRSNRQPRRGEIQYGAFFKAIGMHPGPAFTALPVRSREVDQGELVLIIARAMACFNLWSRSDGEGTKHMVSTKRIYHHFFRLIQGEQNNQRLLFGQDVQLQRVDENTGVMLPSTKEQVKEFFARPHSVLEYGEFETASRRHGEFIDGLFRDIIPFEDTLDRDILQRVQNLLALVSAAYNVARNIMLNCLDSYKICHIDQSENMETDRAFYLMSRFAAVFDINNLDMNIENRLNHHVLNEFAKYKMRRGFLRDQAHVFVQKPFVNLNNERGLRTHVWEPHYTIKEFISNVTQLQYSPEMHNILFHGWHHFESLARSLSDPQKTDFRFPNLELSPNWYAFRNGIYDDFNHRFYHVFHESYRSLDSNLVVYRGYKSDFPIEYMDLELTFDPETNEQICIGSGMPKENLNPATISMLPLDLVFQTQGFDQDVLEFLWATTGRCRFKIGEKGEHMPHATYLIGAAGTGKSVWVECLKDTMPYERFMGVTSSAQEVFGLASLFDRDGLPNRDLIVELEIRFAGGIPLHDLLALISNESILANIKGKGAVRCEHYDRVVCGVGNHAHAVNDPHGALVRRAVYVPFSKVPLEHVNMGSAQIETFMGAFLLKSGLFYERMVERCKRERIVDIRNYVPRAIKSNNLQTAVDTNLLFQFLYSDWICKGAQGQVDDIHSGLNQLQIPDFEIQMDSVDEGRAVTAVGAEEGEEGGLDRRANLSPNRQTHDTGDRDDEMESIDDIARILNQVRQRNARETPENLMRTLRTAADNGPNIGVGDIQNAFTTWLRVHGHKSVRTVPTTNDIKNAVLALFRTTNDKSDFKVTYMGQMDTVFTDWEGNMRKGAFINGVSFSETAMREILHDRHQRRFQNNQDGGNGAPAPQ